MQGVEIDDKHVEVMVRQMLRKVRIIEAVILSYYLVHWLTFIALQMQTEKRLKNVNVRTAKPVLLGITKASLETESFLSRSFQETTRVLTDAN